MQKVVVSYLMYDWLIPDDLDTVWLCFLEKKHFLLFFLTNA